MMNACQLNVLHNSSVKIMQISKSEKTKFSFVLIKNCGLSFLFIISFKFNRQVIKFVLTLQDCSFGLDWLNSHHTNVLGQIFDYRKQTFTWQAV